MNAVDRERRLEGFAQPLGDRERPLLRVISAEQHHKLVASEPRTRRIRWNRPGEPRSDEAEQLVTAVVAKPHR